MTRRRCIALAAIAGAAAPTALAHSFGRQYNLPVPFWLYAYGATAALIVSFVVVAYFATARAAAPAAAARAAPGDGWLRALEHLHARQAGRAIAVAALLLCIATGLFGSGNPYANFNMTFFWIVFLLGCTYASALAGDFYAAINPWAAICDALARTWRGCAQGRLAYPTRLGYWPALALYMAFIWLELFGASKPFSLAIALLAYGAINLLGAWMFGRAAWFGRAEFFGVFFRLIAKMAPIGFSTARDGAPARLRLRAPFAGVLEERAEHWSLLVFVLFMLSSTAFDGLRETAPWVNLFWVDAYALLKPLVGANPIAAYPALRPLYLAWQTLALLLSPLLYLAVYLVFIGLARAAARSALPVRDLALRFAFTLLPIALVYNLTHYCTLIATQGVKVVPLISDPFGRGWNLFGTAALLRAPIIPDAGVVWHTQVALIVLGHAVSVYLAHVEALRTFATPRRATLSQIPMLLLMVIFTTAGLWILAQPIKAGL